MSRLETAKTWAEIMAIAIGAIVAGIFVFRNWEYPNAQLEVVGARRVAASDDRDHLLVDLRFEVGHAGWLRVSSAEVSCVTDGECGGQCRDFGEMLSRGDVAAGDVYSWTCHFDAPRRGCAEVDVEVVANAGFPSTGNSRWRSKVTSCAEALVESNELNQRP